MNRNGHPDLRLSNPMQDRPQFAPRDPETMAESGPQNHPLQGTVDFVEGFAFHERVVREARAAAALAALAGPGPVIRIDNTDVCEKPDTLLIVNRLRRKADVMRQDAPPNSSLRYDLEEVLALVDIIAAQMGGPNG